MQHKALDSECGRSSQGSKTMRHLVGFQALPCRFTGAIDKDSRGPQR